MQSITLQTSDTVVTSGDILGRLNYAASAEADGSAAILIAGSIYVQAEGSFQSSSNPSAIVFATAAADSSSAVSRLKIDDGGNLVPVTDTTYSLGSPSLNFKELHSSSGTLEYLSLETSNTMTPQFGFTGSGVNDTPINMEVRSSFQSATGSGTALLFQGTQGQLFSITDNLSSGTIFNVSDITGLPMLEVTASGDVEIGEFADNITIHQPVLISGGVPSSTTNKLYNNAGALYFNGSALGGSYDDTYVSGVATYASGQAIENESQISSVSGWAGANVTAAINDLVDGAPAALDTLNELAAAINDDASYAATITTALSTKLENVVEDTTPQLGGTLDANGNTIDMGTNTITDTKVGQWDTAYGWGDHSTQGYLTTDSDTTYTAGSGLTLTGTEFNVHGGSGQFREILIDDNFPIVIKSEGNSFSSNGPDIRLGYAVAEGITSSTPSEDGNVIIGDFAASGATGNNRGVIIGRRAARNSVIGALSILIGAEAGYSTESAQSQFIGVGYSALGSTSGCSVLTAIGSNAGINSTSSSWSNFIGHSAGQASQSVTYSNIFGYSAGRSHNAGSYNNYFGDQAALAASGSYNIGIGRNSFLQAAGSNNIEIVTNGNSSSIIGTNDNKIHIENTIIGDTSSKLLAIGNVTSSDLTPDATLEVKPNATTDVGLIVQAAASHSASLQEWQNRNPK